MVHPVTRECGRKGGALGKQAWSFGQAFYCYPFYKKWEKEYLEVVFGKNTVGAQASPSNAGTAMVESPDLKMNTDGGVRNNGWVKREVVSAEMVKEVVMVLKAIFVVCVALLFVLILFLLVLLVK
ncbi:unnamed protein product [Miscanthus lutarioriparius]|uniref:Uncharacterized protein n=1 Tax=Miscanthus lutarioriparius TaxID=422564 RepID=A0A811NL68_9POAL|nr:unnamed protein product [Miscanthus lutarioriparius]